MPGSRALHWSLPTAVRAGTRAPSMRCATARRRFKCSASPPSLLRLCCGSAAHRALHRVLGNLGNLKMWDRAATRYSCCWVSNGMALQGIEWGELNGGQVRGRQSFVPTGAVVGRRPSARVSGGLVGASLRPSDLRSARLRRFWGSR
jgi:hypothetical protein